MTFLPRRSAHAALRKFGVDIVREETLSRLIAAEGEGSTLARQFQFLNMFDDETAGRLLKLIPRSHGQLNQDLVALADSRFASGGYFVEFGAAGGVELSNTYLLEKEFGWNGILAEPAHGWRDSLIASRSCIVEFDCVWSVSGQELQFSEVAGIPELSTLTSFTESDFQAPARVGAQMYNVRTISLLDLLRRHQAPSKIDYLSIDTEGSEYEILAAFDFDAFDIRLITCEHNFNSKRQDMHDLLVSKGYVRKMESVSQFDDWYFRT